MISSINSALARQFHSARLSPFRLMRGYSSAPLSNLVLIDVNDKNGIATVTVNSPPVNSLTLELLTALSDSLDVLNRENPKGMILTSVKFSYTTPVSNTQYNFF